MAMRNYHHRVSRRRRRSIAYSAFALSFALTAAGCSSGEGTGGESTVTSPPVHSGLKSFDEAALQAAFDAGVEKSRAPGAFAIVKTPSGNFTLNYGATQVGGTTKPAAEDHIRIGSATKTMVGAVILQLAQEGKLGLEDPVSKYRPGVPNGANITIEQLLNMRSGLFTYTDVPEVGATLDRDPTHVWQPEELLKIAFANPPHSPPDSAFYYSNTNTVLLGAIAEQLDKKPLGESLADRLFTPLGMKNTAFPAITSNALPDPHPRGYLYGTNEIFLRMDPTLPPEMEAQLEAGTLPLNDVTDENPSWAWSAGAVTSTANDLVTWIDALVGGKVLNAEYQAKWLDLGEPMDARHPDGARYGLAHYSVPTPAGSTLYGHPGEIPGFNTWMFNDPTNEVTIIIWANLCPNTAAETAFAALMSAIYLRP